MSLCYRCEKRAQYLETGEAPRAECKSNDTSLAICYSYEPVSPASLIYPDYENTDYSELNKMRSIRTDVMGARMQFHSIAKCNIILTEKDDIHTMSKVVDYGITHIDNPYVTENQLELPFED